MKCICSRNELHSALSIARDAVGGRGAGPSAQFETRNGALHIRSTDGRTGYATEIAAQEAEPGTVTVGCGKLYEVIHEVPSGDVLLDCPDRMFVVESIEQDIHFTIPTQSAEIFPEVDFVSNEASIALSFGVFRDMVKQVSYAVSMDESRFSMTGISMILKGPDLALMATDGLRLAYEMRTSVLSESFDAELIIPPKILNLLSRLDSQDADISIAIEDSRILFSYQKTGFISNLIQGQVPDFRRVIPESVVCDVTVDTSELIDAVRRISVMAAARTKRVDMELARNSVLLRSGDESTGSADQRITCEYGGNLENIALNSTFLTDALKHVAGHRTVLGLSAHRRSIVVREESDSADRHIIALITDN